MRKFFTDNKQDLEKFGQLLASPKKIVLTAHQNPDGDAYGSIFSLYALLNQMGHEVYAISPTGHADYISWMPGVSSVINFQDDLERGRAERLISEANLIFCLDFSALSRIKDMGSIIESSKADIVLIDHHQEPEDFADFVFWDESAAATCELIFLLINRLNLSHLINLEVATCLYTGILTDTGSFRFDSTTPQVHEIAGQLIAKGINPNRINRKLFDQYKVDSLRFRGFALAERLTYLEEMNVAYFTISLEDQEKFNVEKGDTEGLVNYGLSIAGVVMSVIFIENEDLIKISFRSIENFSVAEMARNHFDGGGHKNASGGKSNLTLKETVDMFLKLLPDYQKSLLEQSV